MNIYTPYVYLLKHTPTGYFYFGSKYGRTTKTHPSSFWVDYFTSSKTIHNLIAEHGTDCWEYEILYTGKNPKDVLNKEKECIKENLHDEMCLNVMVPLEGYDPKDISKLRKVPDNEGMTSYKKGARKGVETKLKSIKNGKNTFQRAYDKALEKNPELHQIRGNNSKETNSIINPNTGLTKYQELGKMITGENNPSKKPENAKKISVGRKKYIAENKQQWDLRQKELNNRLDTAKDENGLTERDRHSIWMKENNPTTGSKWYNNGTHNKRIKEGELIPEGFISGRLKKNR